MEKKKKKKEEGEENRMAKRGVMKGDNRDLGKKLMKENHNFFFHFPLETTRGVGARRSRC